MNILFIVILIISGIPIGLFIGWFIAQTKSRKQEEAVIEMRVQMQSVDKAGEELRRQIAQREAVIDKVRSELVVTQQARTAAETKLEEAARNIEEQKKLLERTEEKLTTTFQALSGESLKSNNKAFIELAKGTLETVLSKAQGELGEKEASIKNIVSSLDEALKRYEQQVNKLEEKRAADYGNLEGQIKSLILNNQQLQKETNNLVTALRRPEVRGRWGELTLKRVVELSGMSEYCDFKEQVSVDTDEGRLRPDMIVHLPAKREIVVDSKVSLDAYIDAASALGDDQREALIEKHGQQVRKHMKALANKNYWDQFPAAPEFVVLFIPGESFLSAALSVDQTLIEDGLEARVIIATPTTLIALLRAIAFGWRQEQITKNAQEIANLGKEIFDRFHPFLEHVNKTSSSLAQATVSFNRMITSLESRVLVSVRKFKDLGAAGEKELVDLLPIEQTPLYAQNIEAQKTEAEKK